MGINMFWNWCYVDFFKIANWVEHIDTSKVFADELRSGECMSDWPQSGNLTEEQPNNLHLDSRINTLRTLCGHWQ